MRLLRIHLRHFRGVHDREIRLAEHGVTVLEGDNEVGKTSTVAALDMLIDDLDSSTKAHVRAAAPTHVDAGPEVEAEIETGPYRFVYRKRWRRRPSTELTVVAPVREQLTGREAHARVVAMLDETMDRELWRALRVEQHTPVGRLALGGHDALTRALDRAADGGSPSEGAGEHDALVERAEAEARRYRTASGRATGPLRAAELRLTSARTEHESRQRRVAEVEADVAARERADADTRRLAARRRAHQDEVTALEERWLGVVSRRSEVDAAREQASLARERADGAAARAEARRDAAAEVSAAAGAVADAEARAAEHDAHVAALRERRDAVREAFDGARDRAAVASAAARDADAALETLRDRAELADLAERLRRAEAADAGLHAAPVPGPVIERADVDRLEELDRALVRAEAVRAAAAATLELEGRADVALTLDGSPVPLSPGEVRRVPVAGPLDLDVADVLSLRLRPGHDDGGRADAVRDAASALATACATLGVADLAGARAALRATEDDARRRDEHRAALDRELDGRSLDELRTARDRLRARLPQADPGDDVAAPAPPAGGPDDACAADPAGRAGHEGPARRANDDAPVGRGADLDTARAEATRARRAAEEAADVVTEAERAWRAADDAHRDAGTEAAVRARALADARVDHDRRREELAAARDRVGDAALVAEAGTAATRARWAEHEHERRAAALADDDPDTTEALLTNARKAGERTATELAVAERERAEADGRLQVAGSEGRHEQLAAAAAELADAEDDHRACERRARAATLLHETLRRRRDEVRRAYVAPFRREVERFARIVFGPSLSLEVDQDLAIVARTLEGVTVGFDALSTGAKEQLGLCARLACATLVDPEDGVPVVIDDALGHTDPDRLARLGAVFTAAASRRPHQVLVLTSTPERYRGVGEAHVVRLEPSRAPEGARPARAPLTLAPDRRHPAGDRDDRPTDDVSAAG